MERFLFVRKSVAFIISFLLLLFVIISACNTDKNGSSNQAAGKALQGNIVKLQGKWQSKEDAAFVIEVKGDSLISFYDGKITSREIVEFVDSEETMDPDPNGDYFLTKGEFDATCYYLIKAEGDILEYSLVGRGNTLSFARLN